MTAKSAWRKRAGAKHGDDDAPESRPFLMFEGKAEEAMTFYVSLFPDGKIVDIVRYGPGQAAAEGSVKLASFTVGGQTVMCIDSPPKHAIHVHAGVLAVCGLRL